MNLWSRLRQSFWFIPALLCLAAVILAESLIFIDQRIGDADLGALGLLITRVGESGSRDLLGAIAGSMLTVASTTFSITIAVLALSSSTYGPRLVRNFMADRGNQFVLGIFVATFLYSLMVLRSIRVLSDSSSGDYFVPHLAVNVAVLLAVLSISVLVYFIHHISDSVQVWTLAERVRADLLGTVDRLYPDDAGEADGEGTGGPAAEKVADRDGEALTSLETGYVQGVDAAGLMAVAAEHDLVVDLRVRPGEYVTQGAVVAVLRPADQVDENGRTSVRQAIRVGRARTPEEDVGFPALLLEEMAVRALSPSTNDPYTAINALDNLATGLVALADRPMPSPFRYDSQGLLRVIAPRASLIDVLEHVLDAMRFYAVAHPTVLHRTLDLIAQVGGAAHDVTVMPRLDAHVRDLVDAFSATSPQGRDLEELNRHASRVRQGLSARREPHA
jgi:uncharacterized membrane protein